MKYVFRLTAVTVVALGCFVFALHPARATNQVVMIDLDGSMSTNEAREKLDPNIKFYFGKASHAAVLHNFGEFVSNKKANGFLRDDTAGCQRAFLSALIAFQQKAQKLGGDAVIELESFYQKIPEQIDKQVPCHSGGLMDGVALRGKIVKLAH